MIADRSPNVPDALMKVVSLSHSGSGVCFHGALKWIKELRVTVYSLDTEEKESSADDIGGRIKNCVA
ncbi:hypothetical protein CEXT_550571 [Caerostris extrusa]|uniref:Uncharacterized protein n=1 Tax=Caerostris extrusa TaxID=172846 RepID=A0AAV4RGA2_CAEEX|nr:hypothetical protein CEXT_550571 [Caerostris extrusa]